MLMTLLCKRWGGSIARCPNCYAILGYKPEDVSSSQNISCPQCFATMWVPFNPNYDGIIEEKESEKNGESVVSEQRTSGESNSGSK